MVSDISKATGTLYIVTTPIGNLSDITIRALDTLRMVSLIIAEDTRRTMKLLNAYEIRAKVESFNEHNQYDKSANIIEKLIAGNDIAYVSDAGTPGISDPGFVLINKAIVANVSIVPIPGVSAPITAISVSGLPMNRFVFYGFLPTTKSEKVALLESLKQKPESMIFFESPLRLLATLKMFLEVFGNRRIVIAREMTKLHEEFLRGNINEIVEKLKLRETIKGEVTIVIDGASVESSDFSDEEINTIIINISEKGNNSLRDIVKEVTEITGVAKSRIYRLALLCKSKK
ncbi:MAG: 16S rRNA (cytidine(1402)-2'-O)-methyltransferase [Deltaproteobacteria bacterium]